jgi:N-acetylmuramoyl-L-alanine amidase
VTEWIDRTAAQKRTVFVSAGHSDTDSGAAANGITEADIVLELRDLVCAQLEGRILFSRDGAENVNMSLSSATKMAAAADIAVEFHCNAATPAATGVETLSKREDFPLASKFLKATVDALGLRNRGAKPENAGQHSRLAFVSDGGGIILELFFLTNVGDVEAYQQNKNALAAALDDVLIEEACR